MYTSLLHIKLESAQIHCLNAITDNTSFIDFLCSLILIDYTNLLSIRQATRVYCLYTITAKLHEFIFYTK